MENQIIKQQKYQQQSEQSSSTATTTSATSTSVKKVSKKMISSSTRTSSVQSITSSNSIDLVELSSTATSNKNNIINNNNNNNTINNINGNSNIKNIKKNNNNIMVVSGGTHQTLENGKTVKEITAQQQNLSTIESTTTTTQMTTVEKIASKKKSDLTNVEGVNKKKSKKSKKTDAEKENISVKSSFSKFDALQKKNILHDVNSETEKNCRSCGKIVYKMEEVKAEKCIWHRNCFRCIECGKQLSVDTYQSHESVLYCKPHFKLLFAPKAVENNEPARPKKPELIIRENQPEELPADVVRASDKPDLGLEELHQLDVKSKFQVFEHLQDHQNSINTVETERSPSGVTRSASILSKLAKFKAKGMDTGVTDEVLSGIPLEQSSSEEDNDEDIDLDNPDAELIRSKRIQKERPMSFGNMNDIKSKFEKGHLMTREERREERKQEIQNIRSRLFMGKQAKIKEMYQQAVAESEHSITSVGKKPEIDIGDKAKSLKEKFEKGEIFNKEYDETDEANNKVQDEEMSVFEQGISKKSRSIFMELDASASKQPPLTPQPTTPKSADAKKHTQPFASGNIVKYDEKPDDIKIETSEISSKFKFFETYKPTEQQKKKFRITPPREGVVKMPSPECENNEKDEEDVNESIDKQNDDDPSIVAQTQTATKMLSIFRQMEQQKYQQRNEEGLKPLKQFTPPPNDNKRLYDNNQSEEEYNSNEEEGEEEEDEEEQEDEEEPDNERHLNKYEDEYLKQAKLEARAKQLRAKFEKWEANEIRREISNGTINVYENVDNDSQIESAKSLRAKFESMREQNNMSPPKPKIQVNRFV